MILYDFYHHSSINESFKNETKINNNFFFLYFFFHEQNVYEYSEQKKEKKEMFMRCTYFAFANRDDGFIIFIRKSI